MYKGTSPLKEPQPVKRKLGASECAGCPVMPKTWPSEGSIPYLAICTKMCDVKPELSHSGKNLPHNLRSVTACLWEAEGRAQSVSLRSSRGASCRHATSILVGAP